MIRSLVNQDVQVHAKVPDFDDVIRRQVESLLVIPVDIDIQRTGMNPLRDLLSTLARKLPALQLVVILAYFVKPAIYGAVASWLAGVPYRVAMIEGLGYAFTSQPHSYGSLLSLKRRALRYTVSLLYRFALALAQAHQVIFVESR